MVKFFCDRCGVEIKPIPHDQRDCYFRIKKVSQKLEFYAYDDNKDTTTIHLCDKCQKDLENFIKASV